MSQLLSYSPKTGDTPLFFDAVHNSAPMVHVAHASDIGIDSKEVTTCALWIDCECASTRLR
jgi:hypothetical protein